MNELKQWVLCLIVAAVAGSFVMVISPRGSMDKTVRAVVGIFVVAVICAPLTELKDAEISLGAMKNFGYETASDSDERLHESVISSLKSAVNEQVKTVADELGITAEEICADLDLNSENCIIIHSLTVKISESSSDKTSYFSDILQERFGVPITVNAE